MKRTPLPFAAGLVVGVMAGSILGLASGPSADGAGPPAAERGAFETRVRAIVETSCVIEGAETSLAHIDCSPGAEEPQ